MSKYSSYILFLLISFLVVILYANDFGPLNHLQQSLDDFLCRVTAPEGVRPNVALVTIDGRAQDEYGSWPWNRDIIADLLAAVASAEPKAIAVNFELNENAAQDSAGYTSILAGQLTWINNVIIPYDIALASFRSNKTSNPEYLFNNSVTVDNPLGLMDEKSSLLVRKVFLPAEKILESKPYLGFEYTMPDNDRILRHQALIMNYEGYYYPSLSLLASAVYLGIQPDQIKVIEGKEIQLGTKRKVPIDEHSNYFISYLKGNAFANYSAADVLGEGFDFARLKNKLILVAVDDFSELETFTTPVQKDMSKAMIKATIMENIINDNFLLNNKHPLLIMLILFAVGGLCAFFMPQISLLHRLIVLVVGFVILVNVNYFLFSSFRIIPETIYIALELFLFLLAAPLLDSQFLRVEGEEKKSILKKKKLPKVEVPKATDTSEEEKQVVVREIKASENDPENQETTTLEALENFPEDHQAINIDEGETEATVATPEISAEQPPPPPPKEEHPPRFEPEKTSSSQPEIITPGNTGQMQQQQRMNDTPSPGSGGIEASSQAQTIEHLGRYQVTGILGKGAMGLVYKGIDPAINRPVALKTIRLDFVTDPQEESELKERLHREAQAAGKLSHPNIVTIYDVGSEGHLQYIAMEYLEGQTLEDLIKKKVKFNYRIIAEIIIQICNALDYAHNQGIVHRDIKPANIMILKDYRVKVMDYGIARIDSSSMTKTGIAMGTPNYISPEQLKGLPTDHRADIFSLGVVMYEMLIGRRPFRGENITSLIYSIINMEPDKPSNINPQIPLLFDHIIMRALKKDPNERYQHAKEIANALGDFVESFAAKG